MKVFFLTNVPSPYRVDFFNELGKSVDLTVVFERDNAKSRNKEWISFNFKNFKYHFLKGKKIGDDGIFSLEVKKYLKEKYDIVLFGNYHTITSMIAMNYCIRHKIKYGLSIDGMFKHESENKFKLKLKKRFFSNASFYVTSGKYSEDVIKYYGGKNVYIYPFTSIRNDYVLKDINYDKTKLKEELSLSEKTILYVGQFVHRKGIDILLNVYDKLQDYELVMIGGTFNEEYQKMVDEKKLNIKVIPFLNSGELEKYYMASDVFVLPTREDQWGLVVNEALAKGLPVVSTDFCLSCYEMLDGCGKMVQVEDVDAYVSSINEILNMDIDAYNKMRYKAIDVASKYTIEKMSSSHLEIFNEILKGE